MKFDYFKINLFEHLVTGIQEKNPWHRLFIIKNDFSEMIHLQPVATGAACFEWLLIILKQL